ncbi:MAG TPA: adenylate/guanylate cyclase domain-containing protein [Stellaceae bacterium]|jgi:class 3 adenylate cyclase|nr:adenylate/guanylate cyclase domain-containing protein [Stellaceae bacterium]
MAVIEQAWEWEFAASPERLWPVLADTERFNEAMGLPRYAVKETPLSDGSVRRVGSSRRGGFTATWDEGVPEWVAPHRFAHHRRFHGGPLRRVASELTIDPAAGGDGAAYSRVRYFLRIETRFWGVAPVLRAGFLRRFGRRLNEMFLEAAAFVVSGREQGLWPPAEPPSPVAQARLASRARTLAEHGYGLADRLAGHLIEAADSELERMRPRVLARRWGVAPRETIETCLAAAREGVLVLRWDLICPRCRGAKAMVTTLDQLPRGAHCDSCNVSFDRDFTRNVEVTFDPAHDIRPLENGTFCIASPLASQHVKVQQCIAAGSSAIIDAKLPDGDYRVRTVELGGSADFRVADGVLPEIILDDPDPVCGCNRDQGRLHVRNATAKDRTLVIEDRRWTTDALTAHEVTTMQAFRDLFSAAVLRPGDEVEIRHVALMFTDIKGSTDLYNRVGDAQAYSWVREHFAVLGRAVRLNNGAVVKTIGDAVMAAFSDPLDALAAAVAIRNDIVEFNRELDLPKGIRDTPIVVKLGLHCGPCIAVTLNDRLDYFGGTVNLTARLESESRGGDIVMSETMAVEPGMSEALDRLLHAEETAAIRGFAQPVRLRRVTLLDAAEEPES